jgi:hypothetical protein
MSDFFKFLIKCVKNSEFNLLASFRDDFAALKGQCPEIFDLRFSTWISFPQAMEKFNHKNFNFLLEHLWLGALTNR